MDFSSTHAFDTKQPLLFNFKGYDSKRTSKLMMSAVILLVAFFSAIPIIKIYWMAQSFVEMWAGRFLPREKHTVIFCQQCLCRTAWLFMPWCRAGTPSDSGYIGLKDDTETSPRRSFFWYFGAESHDPKASLILTMGGGPGSSGLMNALFGQSPCLVTAEGLIPNPHTWTERYNLLVLDHPVGAGFSFSSGPQVNNSRDAAVDVYDFLQRFYDLFPQLVGNKLILDSGSYGGIYVPNIATVIQEGNHAIASGKGQLGAKRLNLESLMIHNPFTDPYSHFRWMLQYRCVYHNVYNDTTCKDTYAMLPGCLEALDYALEPENSDPRHRFQAIERCAKLEEGYTDRTSLEDIRLRCQPDDVDSCYLEFKWDIGKAFSEYGDKAFRHHHLYEPLLADGIRLLHYVGAQDANCPWPGVLSFLKLIRRPFQQSFIDIKEIPWPTVHKEQGYVRQVGDGAGNMTFVLIEGAGHFSVHDQPAIVKSIIEHWIENQPFS
ncbi:alpha/beta-hydrolase [Lentinula aciculospora]|uniref:Alpha/beta-hydrolase n=1 Tax=Lentinula aciculospora TaxID=153920 RepID=A0A9W9A2Z9_9AGAR|nr:alpha/beta-hydrolase [Lentinula aciculospora]